MGIVVLGLNHRTAPVEIREKLAIPMSRVSSYLGEVLSQTGATEAVILSTCNRTEVYAVFENNDKGIQELRQILKAWSGETAVDVDKHLYALTDLEAVKHLFKVSCGLDSMVLGETQVLGQVKDAYLFASKEGTVGKLLHNLFEQSMKVAKRAHTETAISKSAVSVSYAAVELAKKVFTRLDGRQVLIVGAGKMSELTGKHLVASGVKQIIVINRTVERAQELASKLGGLPSGFDMLEFWLRTVDVVITSTGAPHIIIEENLVREVLKWRKGKPLFIVDIAVPRDVSAKVGELENVFLYDIDDLEMVVKSNLRERQKEARRVERIIDEEVQAFQAWLNSLSVVPVITSLRQKIEQIRQAELGKTLAKMPQLGERERHLVETLTVQLVNKILNDPVQRLKAASGGSNGQDYVHALAYLFGLDVPSEERAKGAGTP